MNLRKHPWKAIAAITLAGIAMSTHSQTVITEDGRPIEQSRGERGEVDVILKEVTVTSTRSPRKVDNVPNVVTVTTAEEIQERGDRNIKDLFNNSVDVTVPQQTQRFSLAVGAQGRAGNESVNIRGLQGNNVLLLVDGIRVPNAFSFGALSVGRGNFLDVDGFRRVEVVRGPSSTQYGSDGLAGIVNFQTFNPGDFIKKGETHGGFARTGYSSVDTSSNTTFAYGGIQDHLQGMVLGNFQAGHQYQNQGSNDSTGITRTAPNPADYSNWYVLTKGFAQIDRNQKLGITYESQNVTQNVSNLSDLGVSGGWISFGPTTYNNVVTSTTQDKTTRNRVSGEYDFKDSGALFVQKANVMVYYQDADAIQNAYQQQVGNSSLSSWRSRNNTYSQDTYGINTTLESNLTSVVNQRLTYGFDWSSSQISSQLNAAGNGSSITPAPKSTYNLAGAFLQSEMEFNQISVIPALRYDSYSITPVTGSLPSNSGSAVSPRIGAIWNIAREFRPFANWGTGFTAPTPDQTLSYFAGSGYTNIPNPKLKPQTGNGFEVGARGQLQQFRYQVSGYANSYKDFISQVSSGDRPNQIFQYQNLSKVNIWGWDVRTDWAFAQGWQANAAMAYSDGEQTQHGISAPLNTIQPLRAIAGLRYDASAWGAFANVIWNQGKSADRVNFNNATGGTANQFLSPASTVLNLTGYWKPLKKLTINANLNNVFNTTYWNWSDVQGSVLTQNRAAAGGFSEYNAQAAQQSATAAPRNWQISARYDF